MPGPNLSDQSANRLTEVFGTSAILATTTPGVPRSAEADYRLESGNGVPIDGDVTDSDGSTLFCLFDLSETACAN